MIHYISKDFTMLVKTQIPTEVSGNSTNDSIVN